ncbi:MAG TPA: hypothetical protein VFU60_18300 [Ktedonobacterales bacterium]|nr:hypothetical protein [Ktedonobacterales bacterium]
MATEFDPEEALARWKALEEEKWRGLDVYRASWKADGISGQEKLRLIKDWMTRVNEAQAEERARLLQQLRAAKLSLETTTDGWRLVPMKPWLEEYLGDAEEDEADDADAQGADVRAFDDPLLHLDMGLIKACTMIVAKSALPSWLARGWIELPYRRLPFQRRPRKSETIIARRPHTLAERGASSLIGAHVEGFSSHLGTYGMGGPGFFGLLLAPRGEVEEREYLVAVVWGAGEYLLLDRRVIECHPDYYASYHPWIRDEPRGGGAKEGEEEGGANELEAVLVGATVSAAAIEDDRLRISLVQGEIEHVLEFVKQDPRQPPLSHGQPRKAAFTAGSIADYIVFQPEQATLLV